MASTLVKSHLIIAGNNDRTTFKQAALEELAASIHQDGIAQPPTLRRVIVLADNSIHAVLDKSTEDIFNRLLNNRPISAERTLDGQPLTDAVAQYQIIAGERRTRAMRDILGWDEIPANIMDMDDRSASAIMLSENTNRVDLNPIEEAQAYQKRLDAGWHISEIARAAGRSEAIVSYRLNLLDLIPDAQHLVAVRQLALGHAELLGRLDSNRQRMALEVFNKSHYMPISRWREIVNSYYEAQVAESQTSMFNLAELHEHLVQEAEAEQPIARKGKDAVTGAPVNEDLPPVRWTMKDGIGDILDRYISDLLAAQEEEAAAAIGSVYNALVAINYMNIAKQPTLDIKQSDPSGDLANTHKL